jgi:hypothetical protein
MMALRQQLLLLGQCHCAVAAAAAGRVWWHPSAAEAQELSGCAPASNAQQQNMDTKGDDTLHNDLW